MTIIATYVDSKTFTVEGNQTVEFQIGRRVKLVGATNWYGTIENVVFSTVTTVTLTAGSDNIDATLTEVFYGIVSANESSSSMPIHDHEGEGSGGQLDHTTLSNIGINTHEQIDTYITNSGASLSTISGAVDDNAAAIIVNAADIAVVSGTADQNTSDLVTISGAVALNTAKISYTDAALVASHTDSIALVSGTADTNTASIAVVSGTADTNTTNIGYNTASIALVSGTVDGHTTSIGLNTTHRTTTSGNPHSVSLEEARTQSNELSGDIDFNNNDIVDIKGIGFQDGQEITWNASAKTLDIPTGIGSVLQVGQETLIQVYNNTGEQIDNGTAVYPNGVNGAYATVAKAITNSFENVSIDYGVTTMDIPHGETGFVSRFGKVRELNTNSWTAGDELFISATTSGAITNVKPDFPNYAMQVGVVVVKDALDGVIFVTGQDVIENTTINFYNGLFRESFDFRTSSSGVTVTGTLEPSNGHPDMTMMFSDGFHTLDTTPAAEVLLTPGSATIPQTNYVYVPISTKVLTVSTSNWPSTEHIKVAQIVLLDAALTVSNGALRNQNWNDHLASSTSFQGHLSHITTAIREKIGATWKSGVEAICTVDTGSTPDDVWISTTAGKIMQMHDQTFASFNTATGSDLHIVNHPTTPYTTISNLNTQLLDASGNSLNNTSFSFVLWGVSNKTGEASHLMINLPTNSYAFTAPIDSVNDALNYSVYNIPAQFHGVGFLIARFTFTYKNNVWTLEDTEDLRGKIPNTTAGGGGAGGGGVTTFLGLSDTPSAFTGQAGLVPTVNVGETALEFTAAGAVSSVFSRTGDVVATAGDYSAAQVTNAFDKTTDDADDISDITSANKFTTASGLSKLDGIEAGAEVNNISDTNATDLTDSGDSSLHYHASDRARSNHIGTQLASTISDFSATVSGNTSVLANSAHRVTTSGNPHNITAEDVNCLALDNTTPFTPDTDYEPATKKYVDDNSGSPSSIVYDAASVAITGIGINGVITNTINGSDRLIVTNSGVQLGIGIESATVNKFDTNTTLWWDSDIYVPTKNAVSTYVTTAVSTHTALPDAHHNRFHNITSVGDHYASANSMFYSTAAGYMAELSFGTSGYVLTSNGPATAPSWTAAGSASPLTTKGDLYTYSTTDARLPVGADNYVLTADSSEATGLKWTTPSTGFTDPMTTRGDIIYRNSSNVTSRLGRGTSGYVLTSNGTDISWAASAGGTSDKIEEGNSSVEVVDAGTGYVSFILDGVEKARLSSLGRFLIGDGVDNPNGVTTSSPAVAATKDGGQAILSAKTVSTTAGHWAFMDLCRTRGTLASPESTQAGDNVAAIAAKTHDGNAYKYPALLGFKIDGAVSTNVVPGKVTFDTQSTNTRYERLVIDSVGCTRPGADDSYNLGSSSYRWDDIYATNSTIQTSDERLKTSISGSDLGLDFICNLTPVSYKWKDYTISGTGYRHDEDIPELEQIEVPYTEEKTFNRTHYGMIAQDVITTCSGMDIDTTNFAGIIYDEDEDRYGLRYTEFIAPMIKAIQELSDKNTELQNKYDALLARVVALEV